MAFAAGLIHSAARLERVPIPTPVTAAGVDGLARMLAEPRHAVLAFDYDGVLAPIVEDPERSPPHPRAVPALARLAPLVGSIVIITGRPAAVAVAYGEFEQWPDAGRPGRLRPLRPRTVGRAHPYGRGPAGPAAVDAARQHLPGLRRLDRRGRSAHRGQGQRPGRAHPARA